MADTQPTTGGAGAASGGLVVPPEVQEKFAALIELVKGSESMNNEERQYWVNILPIMTPEQLKNLEEILLNEKKQLAAIDEKYSKEVATIGDEKVVAQMEEEIKRKRSERAQIEKKLADEEGKTEDSLLQQIQNF
ncbi:MAG TPA: hypothetical protein PKV72_04370 [Candidatus Peribacteria bacterium]|nr:hypothetical protein [Candidatus Peribacteria bacterium]